MRNYEQFEEKREELVEDEVKYLMRKGHKPNEPDGEYYPFTTDNFMEAMTNGLSLADQILMASYAGVANTLGTDVAKEFLANFVIKCANAYWEKLALEKAEQTVSSVNELYEDERAYAADMAYEAAKDRRMGL